MAKTNNKPYKMTPERVAIILEGLSNGLSQRDCALLAGIHEDTLCSWKFNNSEFSEQMGQKSIEYKQKLIKRVTDAGEKDWKATAWILERKFKDDFSPHSTRDNSHLYDFPPMDIHSLNTINHDKLAQSVVDKLRED